MNKRYAVKTRYVAAVSSGMVNVDEDFGMSATGQSFWTNSICGYFLCRISIILGSGHSRDFSLWNPVSRLETCSSAVNKLLMVI